MTVAIPTQLHDMLVSAHPDWHATLASGLQAVAEADPAYLSALLKDAYLPTQGRLFAAFCMPIDAARYVLVGEGPYPRAASATGVCFMDGAVGTLWSETGLSKAVNRATSLRNFMKMLLVADGRLAPDRTAGDALAGVATAAQQPGSTMIQTLPQLQENLFANGFLLLNAALVFRADVPPLQEARAWRPFLEVVLAALQHRAASVGQQPPTLVLWGKAAAQIDALSVSAAFPKVVAEHPYNLSFITNVSMQRLFGSMALLEFGECRRQSVPSVAGTASSEVSASVE